MGARVTRNSSSPHCKSHVRTTYSLNPTQPRRRLEASEQAASSYAGAPLQHGWSSFSHNDTITVLTLDTDIIGVGQDMYDK
ncbi:hypothetical protein GJ744_010161 [Endocarpon pusillum]|uniref:Uncharacterized protein n=1 Tax=Endocarpon pusillum TaxID=364733 RepID=A0A8H7E380_9EURO|nr:hypothetical protein GJ744_010161 [Endocarpon pusillum]